MFKQGLSLLSFLTLAVVSINAHAESKIAVVDVQRVIQSLPQVATIEQTINAEFNDQRQEIQKLQADGQFMVQKLQRERATMSEDEVKKLEEQIQTLGQELQQKAQPLQQNIQRRTNEERQKLVGMIQQSINTIASSEGYDLVLNANAVPYTKPEHDISQRVLDAVSKLN